MYCNPDDLKAELISCQQAGQLSDTLAAMLMQIAEGVSARWNNMPDRDELQSQIVYRLCLTWHKADTSRTGRGLFNYLTTVSFNAARYYNQQEVRYFEQRMMLQAELIAKRDAARCGRCVDRRWHEDD